MLPGMSPSQLLCVCHPVASVFLLLTIDTSSLGCACISYALECFLLHQLCSLCGGRFTREVLYAACFSGLSLSMEESGSCVLFLEKSLRVLCVREFSGGVVVFVPHFCCFSCF